MKGMNFMKKNAIVIAGILFVAGCATGQDQRTSHYYSSPSQYDSADATVSSVEVIERDSRQAMIPPTDVDVSTVVSQDAAAGGYGASVSSSAQSPTAHSSSDDDIHADSSKRGGTLDARGYDQDAKDDKYEGTPDSLNPAKQADSSVRGGSISAREREWNYDVEPSPAESDPNLHLKADSSIRGGSVEARGGREGSGTSESSADLHSSTEPDFDSDEYIRASGESDSRDDFGQGSSATWESDKAHGSVRGSANWNASDDLLRDGVSDQGASYELNNDASVGGAARSEVGEGSSSLDKERLESEDSASPDLQIQPEPAPADRIEPDLNSSEQLEENLSGRIDLNDQESKVEKRLRSEASSTDSSSSTISSASPTDVSHDQSELNVTTDSNNITSEAVGSAATSERGSSNSEIETESNFQSNDPALNSSGSPLGTPGGEPNFLYQDNRALGVGSAATGEFASSPVNQGASVQMDDDQLASSVKGTLTRESSGTDTLLSAGVARNLEVSAEDGEVTLTGAVPSERDKALVEARVREIPGVQRVKNMLTVTPESNADHRVLN